MRLHATLTILRDDQLDRVDEMIAAILADRRKGEWRAPRRFEIELPDPDSKEPPC